MRIPPLSTINDVKLQYKKLAKKFHTDLGGSNEKMQEINWAYKTLINYMKNYKFTFSEEEISKQYPEELLKKFKV